MTEQLDQHDNTTYSGSDERFPESVFILGSLKIVTQFSTFWPNKMPITIKNCCPNMGFEKPHLTALDLPLLILIDNSDLFSKLFLLPYIRGKS
jgi:hypothetical protein